MSHYNKFNEVFKISGLPASQLTEAEYMYWQGVYAQFNTQKNKSSLSAYQAEITSKILAAQIHSLHEDLQEMKSYVKFCWKRAEPGYVAGDEYFKELNRARNKLLKIKKSVKVLEDIQKSLKKTAKEQ